MAQALLLIADIGGYTKFMTVTRANLGHSQQMVADILEAVIDAAAPTFELAKLEGDAAFFYTELKNGLPRPEVMEQILARMQLAFRTVVKKHVVEDMCSCDGCVKSGQLTIKFVSHVGEVAFQKVKTHRELAGVDVIVVHRMLKNDVPIKEYVLFTEPLVEGAPPSLKPVMTQLEHDFEGIGPTQTFYAPLEKLPVPEPVIKLRPYLIRLIDQMIWNVKSLPYMLGLKRRPMADIVAPKAPQLTSSTTPS